jgi:hypothetical protein
MLKVLLHPEAASLGQIRLSAGVTETFLGRTDLGLGLSYYLYTADPTEVGIYSFSTLGRRSSSFGEGVAIAPEWWKLRLDVAERLWDDRLQASLSFTYGSYVNDPDGVSQGWELVLGVSVQWRINRAFRVWLSGTGQRTVDATGLVAYTGSAATGIRIVF